VKCLCGEASRRGLRFGAEFFRGVHRELRKTTIDDSILRFEILFPTYVFCAVTVDF